MKLQAVKRGTQAGGQRFFCHACKGWFTQSAVPPRQNHRQTLLDHVDGISYRRLEDRYGVKKDQLCRIVNRVTAHLKPVIEVTRSFFPQCAYSGIHIVDGKYVPVQETVTIPPRGKVPRSWKRRKVKRGRGLVWGTDSRTHDVLHYEFGFSENLFLYGNYFKILKELGYLMKSCTLDEKKELIDAALAYFPDCIIQLCIRHYLANLSSNLGVQHIIVKINSHEKKLNRLFPNKDRDRIPPSRQYALARAIKYHNAVADLEFHYELLLAFWRAVQGVVCAETYAIALRRIDSLEKYFLPRATRLSYPPTHVHLVHKLFKDLKTNQERLLNYLKYPHMHIPRTTNL